MDFRPALYLLALCLVSMLAMFIRPAPKRNRYVRANAGKTKRGLFIRNKGECQPYKELYFKLHHLEQHADVLPEAKSLLLSFFSEALQSECKESTILSIDGFSAATVDSFVRKELDAVTREWHDYLARRKAGKHRELFQSAADARRWLVRMAPIKFVDGVWLGHIHKATTPFADRRTTKAAWQVLSEELGDGNLAKSHAYVYAQLLQKIGVPVVAPDSIDFIRYPGMDDARVWRSALSQLLISLFPHEFLPEILGFNLNFEMLTLETLVTAKELREVGFDPYYFTLHITIDNADTGHTAMASSIVTEYLRSVAARKGDAAAHQAWKRVQAGFVLCKNLNLPSNINPPLKTEKEILAIFQAKAAASNRVHESCPVSFGGRSLSTWLKPEEFARPEWQMDFLRCLGNAEPWVYKGNSSRSRLIQQLAWGGSMFGAFTDREVAVVRDWIDRLVPQRAEAYMTFTGRTDMDESPPQNPDLRVDYPVFAPAVFDVIDASQALVTEPLTVDMSKLDIHRLLPLWFTHPCLLESFVCVP